jgi:hypothetical protein
MLVYTRKNREVVMDPQVPAEVEEQVARSTNEFLTKVSPIRIIRLELNLESNQQLVFIFCSLRNTDPEKRQ